MMTHVVFKFWVDASYYFGILKKVICFLQQGVCIVKNSTDYLFD